MDWHQFRHWTVACLANCPARQSHSISWSEYRPDAALNADPVLLSSSSSKKLWAPLHQKALKRWQKFPPPGCKHLALFHHSPPWNKEMDSTPDSRIAAADWRAKLEPFSLLAFFSPCVKFNGTQWIYKKRKNPRKTPLRPELIQPGCLSILPSHGP